MVGVPTSLFGQIFTVLGQMLYGLRSYVIMVIGAMLALFIAEFFIDKMAALAAMDRAEMDHFTGVLKASGITWMKASKLTKSQKEAIRLHERYKAVLKDEGRGVSIHT